MDLRQQFPHPPSDLDQTNTQGIELHPARAAALYELPPQSVHQLVGASVQQQPKPVGDEPMAAEAIRLHVHLEVARYLKDALANERAEGVASSPVSPLRHAPGDCFTQTQLGVHLGDPEKPAV